jgi:hypothetical protein
VAQLENGVVFQARGEAKHDILASYQVVSYMMYESRKKAQDKGGIFALINLPDAVKNKWTVMEIFRCQCHELCHFFNMFSDLVPRGSPSGQPAVLCT